MELGFVAPAEQNTLTGQAASGVGKHMPSGTTCQWTALSTVVQQCKLGICL